MTPPPTTAAPFAVTVPLRLGCGPNAREHHMARHRRVKRERAAVAAWLFGVPRLPDGWRALITLTRVGGRGRLDDDNLQGSLKACRDATATALGVDDGSPRLAWAYRQEPGRAWAVRVEIERVEGG